MAHTGKVWGKPGSVDHQRILDDAIGHHTGPIIHHYVIIDRNHMGSTHADVPAIGTRMQSVGKTPSRPHPLQMIKRAHPILATKRVVNRVRGIGHKSTTPVKRVVASPRIQKAAHGYSNVKEAYDSL